MNENNNVEDCLVHGWVVDVRNYADWWGISLKVATREIKKACVKLGFKVTWDFERVESIVLIKSLQLWFPVNQDVIDNATKDGRFVHLEIERVIKKRGIGWKAKINKTEALKQYIKEVLKPDNSKAA